MARTPDDGLKYFPLDVHFFSEKDTKIIRSRYGSDGIMVYIYLLCEVYKQGYCFQADDDFIYVMSDELNIKENLSRQIINFFLSRSLFDNTLWQSDKVLTSVNIQKQYQESKKKSVKRTVIVDKRFWLLKNFETESFIKVYPDENNSEKKDDYSEKKDDYSMEYATKENKINKNKIKENKVKQNKINGTSIFHCKTLFLYNYICMDYPECRLTDKRMNQIDMLMLDNINGKAVTLHDIAECFRLAQSSEFLKGEVSNFKASLDWLLEYKNLIKVLEYKYNKHEKQRGYDLAQLERLSIGYIPQQREKLPEFCKDCKHRNPYQCIIECENQEWNNYYDLHSNYQFKTENQYK